MNADAGMDIDELAAIVDVLWFLPPPARLPIAQGMHGLGVRVHPELATSVMVAPPGMGAMGNHAPRAPMAKRMLEFLEESNPELAAQVVVAQSDPEAKARLKERMRETIAPDLAALREHGARLAAEHAKGNQP